MRWKLITLIAALLVVGTSAPPNQVAAQEGIDQASLISVAGLGTNQTYEGYWLILSPLETASPLRANQAAFLIALHDPSDAQENGACTQTIRTTVPATSRLNTLTLGTPSGEEHKELEVNGVFAATLGKCFDDAIRVFYEVAVPVGFPNLIMLGTSTVNLDGSTAASDGSMLVMERSFSVGGIQ